MSLKAIRKNIPKTYLTIILSYLLYLTMLPAVVRWLTPCLNLHIGTSYAYSECNTVIILDRFIMLALPGFAASVLTMLITRNRKGFLTLSVFAVFIALFTIGAYYLYIPIAEASAKGAPILLESLMDTTP